MNMNNALLQGQTLFLKTSWRGILTILTFACLFLSFPNNAVAQLADENRWIALPGSIYSDDATLDMDRDWLIDDYENRLADTWRPYFIFDEGENDFSGGNVDDYSLLGFEPVVIFQVRPLGDWSWPRHIKIKWVFLFRLDGGYRGSNYCLDWHYGDSQSGEYDLVSWDGINWAIDKMSLWNNVGWVWANSGVIQWTSPRSTYFGQMAARPSPIIYASAGKHHQYTSGEACEDEPGFCDDDCGGGAQRLANLVPNGYFTNVGEKAHHPNNLGTNRPFVNTLDDLGYPNERVWSASWICTCDGVTSECFTGGTGYNWQSQNCTIPTAVHKLLDETAVPSLTLVGDVYVARSTGTAFTAGSMWHSWFCINNEDCKVGDVNGDGKDDIIAFTRNNTGDVYVALSTGHGFSGTGVKWHDFFCINNEVCEVGDVNGDGKDDIIAFSRGNKGDVYVALSTGYSFSGTGKKWHDFFCINNEECRVGDVNGDDKDDIIAFSRGSTGDVYVALSTGYSFSGTGKKWHNFFCINDEVCQVGDVNGDDKDDIIAFSRGAAGDVYVSLSTGSSFSGTGIKWHNYFCINHEICEVADVNNDHKADIIAFSRDPAGNAWVATSTGSGFYGTSWLWGSGTCVDLDVCRVGDVTGDHRADVISFRRQ